MKFLKLIIATVLYVILLMITYYVHITYFRVNVVFYSSMTDAAIATVIGLGVMLAIKWLRVLSVFEGLQLVCIWLLLGYSFAISVPTVIDRSLSFYILEKLQQRGGGIRLDAFEQVFTKEYVNEHRLVDVRLTEQQQSGTIMIEQGCVKLTSWGNTLASASRYFRVHFLPKQRLLIDQYSDALTDPFRNAVNVVNYQCK